MATQNTTTLSFQAPNGGQTIADGIATDGDNGSTDIVGKIIDVYAINPFSGSQLTSGGKLWYVDPTTSNEEVGFDGYVSSVTWVATDDSGNYGLAVKSRDGSNFSLTSLQLADWGGSSGSFTAEAFDSGVSKAMQTFTLAGNEFSSYFTLALNSDFGNVDEVRIYRSGGGESWLSINNVTIADAVPPVPAAPSAPDLVDASDSGSSSTDNITFDTSPTFSGSGAEAGATVRLYANGTEVGSTTADSSGNWTVTSSARPEGTHTFTARVEDLAGNLGPASPGLTVTIDYTTPDKPSVPSLAIGSDTGPFVDDYVTNDTTPTLTGTAEAGTLVRLYDGGDQIGSTTADTAGNWTITIGPLVPGNHTFEVTAEDMAGNVSLASASLVVSIDTTAPVVNPGASSPSDNATGISPDSQIVLSLDEPVYQGTSGVITLYNVTNGTVLQTLPFNSASITGWGTGTITINPSVSLPEGKTVAVRWDGTVFQDWAGNFVAANGTDTLYNFSVKEEDLAPTATNLTQTVALTEDGGSLPLSDIVVTDANTGETITATLTLSTPAAGSLTTGTYGSATSTFNAATGVWTVTGTVANVNAALAAVSFTPSANHDQNFTITTRIRDAAGTGPADGTITVNVRPVNDAPIATVPGSISVTEDTATAITGLFFSDLDSGSGIVTVTLSVPTGSLAATSSSGVTVGGTASSLTLTGTITDINAFIASSNVVYTTTLNDTAVQVMTVSINDNGNIGSGGALSDTKTVNLNVTAVNDAPVIIAPEVIQAQEDTPIALTGISFSDIDAGPGIVTVTLSVPAGVLTAAAAAGVGVGGTGSAVIIKGTIAAINSYIEAGNVTYLPASGDNGTRVLTITINDGDSQSHTVTVDLNVSELNDAPTSADNTVTLAEDGSYTFKVADFAFADLEDMPQNGFMSIVITDPPGRGRLSIDGETVVAGREITLADIARLVYTPDENGHGPAYGDFLFRVKDNGGTENGGSDTSEPYRMHVDVTPVSDAPDASNRTISIAEDTSYTFQASDFGFQDTADAGSGTAHTLKAVIITGLPAAGRLTLDDVDVAVDQSIDAADIGRLKFVPADDANGAGYATFKFKVQDNGGTASSGKDTSEVDYTFRIDVAPANDDPSGVNDGPVVVIEAGIFTAEAATGVLANDPDIDGDDLVITGFRHGSKPSTAGSTLLGDYGELTLNADGSYSYVASSSTRTMRAGQAVTDTFEYSISDEKGGSTTASITFRIEGRNDAAVIGGDVGAEVAEDAVKSASGVLTVSDVDLGEAGFQAMANVQGTYGTFSFDHLSGQWTYLLDNASPAVQALDTGDIRQETFTVKAVDGTERSVTVLVNGASDSRWLDLNNTISGGAGRDTIFGGAGADRISGGGGNDHLDGGSGNDTLSGGSGNDRLYGGTGNDSASGGTGSDRVYGGSGSDRLYGNSGNDRLYGEAGNDRLTGGSGNDSLFGGNGRDTITGGSGNDRIHGGLGADLLIGGQGKDSFVFDTKPGKGNVDTIQGFNPLEDRIILDNTVFKKVGSNGTVDENAFWWGKEAHDASDRILYDLFTGALSYDADGNGSGAAVKIAQMDPWLMFNHESFRII
jgi:VCBS repeat-containing protein